MAFDLFSKKRTDKDWSRSSSLITLPTQPPLVTTTKLTEAIDTAKALTPGMKIQHRGKGAVVSKKWRW